MSLLGFDLNATRVLAVSGPAEGPARPLPLEGLHLDLPLALSLQGRHPEVGRAGLALCRRSPHLACLDFLPHLGGDRRWGSGRQRLDSDKALTLVVDYLHRVCSRFAEGLALAVPVYLRFEQVERLTALAGRIKGAGRTALPLPLGSVASPLALAWTAHLDKPWSGLAVVVEVDDHALTLSAVGAEDQKVRLLGQQVIPTLNLLAWKNRLLDALANACVRHSRRDPRDSAQAEQMLFDQLDRALETYRKGQLVELDVQAEHWYQNLILRPEEVAGFCTSLVQQAVKGMELLLGPIAVQDAVQEVLLTETAGRLPGLAAALEKATGDKAPATLLAGDAAAQAAQRLAGRVSRGDLPRGHLGSVFPFSGGHAPASLVNHQPKRVLPLRTADL